MYIHTPLGKLDKNYPKDWQISFLENLNAFADAYVSDNHVCVYICMYQTLAIPYISHYYVLEHYTVVRTIITELGQKSHFIKYQNEHLD